MYRILFKEIPATKVAPRIPEGYYKGHIGINNYIYGRGKRNEALLFNQNEAIRYIQRARNKGYPCCAEPTITVQY